MRVRGLRTLQTAVRLARARVTGGGLILLYHRIAPPEEGVAGDPFRLCVSPHRFAEHLRVLAGRGGVVPLSRLVRPGDGEATRGRVAITFDDGYLDNLERAKPLLDRHEMPATFFVVSGFLGRRFWWDRLISSIFSAEVLPSRLDLTIAGKRRSWKIPDASTSSRRGLLFALYRMLKSQRHDHREALVADLSAWSNGAAGGPRAVTEDELVRLGRGGLFEIGCHGATHSPLAAMERGARRAEIVESKARLEAILRRPITSFSYPFGERRDVDSQVAGLVRRSGFECACTNIMDVVRARGDSYRLPRMWVGNWSGAQFAARLRRWIGDRVDP